MGNSIHLRNTVTTMPDVAKIQNAEHHREDAQHQQTAMIMQKESALKETQVQMSNKANSVEAQAKRKLGDKGKNNPRKRQIYRKNGKDENNKEEEHIVDFKI
jgi:hypothetical protein